MLLSSTDAADTDLPDIQAALHRRWINGGLLLNTLPLTFIGVVLSLNVFSAGALAAIVPALGACLFGLCLAKLWMELAVSGVVHLCGAEVCSCSYSTTPSCRVALGSLRMCFQCQYPVLCVVLITLVHARHDRGPPFPRLSLSLFAGPRSIKLPPPVSRTTY